MDRETKELDGAILAFIEKYSGAGRAPDKEFEALALRIFTFQFARNENYRRFCETEAKSPATVRDWFEIPAMPSAGFKELVLATFPVSEAVKKFRTSGTTQGVRGVHFFDTLRLYEAAILPPFERHLLAGKAALRFCFLISAPGEASDSSLSHMMGVVDRRFAGSGGKYYVKKGAPFYAELAADLRKARGPVLILATAFSLKGFLEHLAAGRVSLELPRGSRMMETGGFKGRANEVPKKALYLECRKRLGIETANCVGEYGMTELSSQYYAEGGGAFVGPAWIRAAAVDPVTGRRAAKGRRGVLRHFDLANRGSVLAVQTEDLGREKAGGFEFAGRAGGAELRGCSLSYEEFLKGAGSGRR